MESERITIPQRQKRTHYKKKEINRHTPEIQESGTISTKILETKMITHPSFKKRLREYIILDRRWVWRGSPCWIWVGTRDRRGYGITKVGSNLTFTHRVMYQIANGSIPPGNHIDHKCRIKSCCNPKHLEPVSPEENLKRAGHGYTQSWKRGNKLIKQKNKKHYTTPNVSRKIQPP